MFTIGEFSRLTQFSIKALRLYHERGLLIPGRVDAATGYRQYEERDLERAFLIQRLRILGLSLDDIQRILAQFTDDGDLVDFLERKRTELEGEMRRLRVAVAGVRDLIAKERAAAAGRDQTGRVEECELPAVLIASLRWKGCYGDCGIAIGRIARAAAWRIAGPPFNLYHDAEYHEDGADIETCFPIKKPFAAKEVTIRELPPMRCLRLMHAGPYEQLGRSYARLMAVIKQRGLRLAVPMREVYVKGPGMIFRGNPARYLTEIHMPFSLEATGTSA